MKRWLWVSVVIAAFIVSRLYVLANPPFHKVIKNGKPDYEGYSDVQHDSERYANMWYYGLTPYRKHLFEYPPAAIPLMYIPLLVDQQHIGHYYLNYRVQIFLLEGGLFAGILLTVLRLPLSRRQQIMALAFYIGAGVLAKDYWYDGLDLAFFGSYTMGLVWYFRFGNNRLRHRIITWAWFFLSVAIKLLTVPLMAPLAFFERFTPKKTVIAIAAGALIVWGIPLALYRSSLSVFLFFHAARPLKYEAFPTFILRTINDFTHTEVQSTILPHLPMIGPISTIMERIVGITFPAAMLLALGWGVWQIFRRGQKPDQDRVAGLALRIQITLVYLFALFLASKIFSRPFHLWYVPLITIYPFKNLKTQLVFIGATLFMLLMDTTTLIKVPEVKVGPVLLDRFRDLVRFLPMFGLLFLSLRLPRRKPV